MQSTPFALLVASFLALLPVASAALSLGIPGCPDLASLPGNVDDLNSDQLSNLKCFCSASDELDDQGLAGISVNCIFGSHLEDLAEVLIAIADSNRTVHRISLDHIEVDNSNDAMTLEETLSADCLRDLRELEIKQCRGTLVERRDNPIVEFSDFFKLESVSIEDCDMEGIPSFLLEKTATLRILSLPRNKIGAIRKADLAVANATLELLDLTSNVITVVEEEAISQLRALKTLLVGEHNHGSDSFLQQIGQLPALQTLDMTRMDGVNSLSKLGFAQGVGGKKLTQWTLTGCNLQNITNGDFDGLDALEMLDMRVNLVENIEPGSFISLRNLKELSLAGNFLKSLDGNEDLWLGLDRLQSLDLGWNDLTILEARSFVGIGDTLKSLSLRHNEKLSNIQGSAFEGLENLRFLNLSGTALRRISNATFAELTALQELYLSGNRITEIDVEAFQAQQKTIEKISLDSNNLTAIDTNVLRELQSLKKINIANNPWLCDDQIWPVIEWIRKTYRDAAEKSTEFFLEDSNMTLCARPYEKAGRSLLEFKEADLSPYDEKMDTTTAKPLEATTTEEERETTTLIDFENLFHIVGGEGNDTLDAIEDAKKPKYDINVVRFGQKTTSKNPTNSMFATVAVSLLVLVTAIGMIWMVKRRKNEAVRAEKPSSRAITSV